MKKALLSGWFCLLFLLAGFNAQAQLPDYTIAPDFTGTDLNGNEINLYSILDEGKSVILDLSATWCGPCWSYHQTHILNDVYNAYGPNGTNEIEVIMVEADPSTGLADLQGNTSSTQGDWITGTDYPIIDDASIGDLYNVTAYPTFYFICPNRVLTENPRFQTVDGHYGRLQDLHCQAQEGMNNAGILTYTGFDEDLFCGTISFDPEVRIQNLGTSNMTDANIEVYNNGALVGSTPWSGDLAPFQMADVTLSTFASDVSTDMVINISSVNGGTDDAPGNNMYSLAFNATDLIVEYEKLTLNITTDQYACENYWTITNKDNGEVVASGGNPNATAGLQAFGGSCAGSHPPGTYANSSTIVENIIIPADGCYEFRFIDDFGDGMCCNYGQGGYSLMDGNGIVLASGGNFGASSALPFGIERLISGTGAEQEMCEGETAEFTFDLGLNFSGTINYLATGEGTIAFDQASAAPGATVTGTISGLTAGTHVITVTASDGAKTATKEYTFIVGAAPEAATLIEPANGATMIAVMPTLNWDAVDGVTQYFVEIATDDQFNNIVKTATTFTNAYVVNEELIGGTDHFWRVSVANDCGQAIADPFGFTTEETNSIGELNGISVDVRPNPTRGMVHVFFSQPTYNQIEVEVYSLEGKLLQSQRVAEQAQISVDLSDYENGLYLIKLIDAEKALTSKVFLSK